MRLIGLEEHFRPQAGDARIGNFQSLASTSPAAQNLGKLGDLGEGRLADMDAAGIDVQVVSRTVSGLSSVGNDVEQTSKANDELARAIAAHPDRLAGFASLPLSDPEASVREFERGIRELGFKGALVNGMQGGLFLDDKSFWPLFELAEELDAPIYLHPSEPPDAVRNAYYHGLEPSTAQMLATSAWGWHVETGLHALRLIVSGLFDSFPRLKIIIGHMGEAIPFMLDRASRNLKGATKLGKPISDYFLTNFYITTSGMFAIQPFLCLLLVAGADRIIFSVDYPYSSNEDGRAFIEQLPISPADREKIAHINAERLLGL